MPVVAGAAVDLGRSRLQVLDDAARREREHLADGARDARLGGGAGAEGLDDDRDRIGHPDGVARTCTSGSGAQAVTATTFSATWRPMYAAEWSTLAYGSLPAIAPPPWRPMPP